MNTVMLFGLIVLALLLAIPFAAAVATKITYGFHWVAILGLRHEAKRIGVMYVSNGPFLPTPIFWLGSTEEQENLVAQAMAEGKIHRQNVDAKISRDAHWNALVNKVQIWPSAELRQRFGGEQDIAV